MSHDLSFDGDSDGVSITDRVQMDESFDFDVSSHLPNQEKSPMQRAFDTISEKEQKPDVGAIHGLHSQVVELLSPKNEESLFSEEEEEESYEISEQAVDKDADGRSVYIGNVDYSATVNDLSAHFSSCGSINRITIGSHKATGKPKGYAYIEFADRNSVMSAMALNETLFKGRLLKICPKRTNIPGLVASARSRPSRGGRGRARGGTIKVSRRPARRGRGRGSYRAHKAEGERTLPI